MQRVVIDGAERGLVSAVPFRDLDFRFQFAPWLRFAFGQTNYRAYVLFRGEPCVWFFGTSLATPFVLVPQLLWRLPWHYARMRFDTAWQDERCRHYHLHTTARWGCAAVEIEGTDDEPAGTYPASRAKHRPLLSSRIRCRAIFAAAMAESVATPSGTSGCVYAVASLVGPASSSWKSLA